MRRKINIVFRAGQSPTRWLKMGWPQRTKYALIFLCLRLIQLFRGDNSAAEIEVAKRRIAERHGIREEEVMDYLAEAAKRRQR